MFRRVLVGFDGSRGAEAALRAGLSLASASDGEVTVVVVASASQGETAEDRRAAFADEVGPLVGAAEQQVAGLGHERPRAVVHAVVGDRPAEALSSYLLEHGFDLLVVGRHGRDHAARGGLGRVAKELADKGRCPLLLVGDGEAAGD
jgi:nucleotide-binding universal stress UspA family protein